MTRRRAGRPAGRRFPASRNAEEIEPGFLTLLDPDAAGDLAAVATSLNSTGRRTALAQLADAAGQPADDARDGQPHLAVSLRPRPGRNRQRLRPARRAAEPPRAARLAGQPSSSRAAGASSDCTG